MKKILLISLLFIPTVSLADEATDKRIAQLEERMAKLEKLVESLSGKKDAPTPAAKVKNKYGIPDDVFEKIEAKASAEWPDDFSTRKFAIEMEVKAYKSLHE